MKLLCITDVHGQQAALERILTREQNVDVILLGGDLTNFGSADDAQRLIERCQQDGRTVLAVSGNCDSPQIDERLVQLGVSLFGRGRRIEGVGFFGVSAMPPWTGSMYELSEDEIRRALDNGRSDVASASRHVVLSHPPPRGCRVDCTRLGQHVGSTALREFIDQTQPLLVVCGHIHEARGTDKLGQTTVVNCGPAFQGFYAVAELDEAVTIKLARA